MTPEQMALPMDTRTDLEREAVEFHEQHPEVYALICDVVDMARKGGLAHWSINGVFEVIRWHYRVERGDREFKLNNNYRAWYARKWREDHPEQASFFSIRRQAGE